MLCFALLKSGSEVLSQPHLSLIQAQDSEETCYSYFMVKVKKIKSSEKILQYIYIRMQLCLWFTKGFSPRGDLSGLNEYYNVSLGQQLGEFLVLQEI